MSPGSDDFRFSTARLTVAPVPEGAPEADFIAETTAVLSSRVTAFLPPALQFGDDPDASRHWLISARREGVLLSVRTHDDKLVGFCLLGVSESTAHLGYLFAEAAWGQGFATELVQGLVRHLRATGSIAALKAGVPSGNTASARVLVKAGFEQAPDPAPDGSAFYQIDLKPR